jgi:hypothetical protein
MSLKSYSSVCGLAAGIGLMAATSMPAVAVTTDIVFQGGSGRISSSNVSGTDYTIVPPPAASPLFFTGKLGSVNGFGVSDSFSFALTGPATAVQNGLSYTASFEPGGTLSAIGGISSLGIPSGSVLETADIGNGVFQVNCNDNGCSNGTGIVSAQLNNIFINPTLLAALGVSGPLSGMVTLDLLKVELAKGTVSTCFPAGTGCFWHSTSMNNFITNFPAEVPGEIPLPATLPLFSAGLGMLALVVRRRKIRAAAAS